MRSVMLAIAGIFVFFTSGQLIAEQLPPVGKRVYVVDIDDPAAPTAIQTDEKSTKKLSGKSVVLKDPILSTTKKKVRVQKKVRKKRAVRKIVAKESSLKFKGLKLKGRLTKPRVQFERDLVEVGRSDEPVQEDFYNRVFLPVEDSDF